MKNMSPDVDGGREQMADGRSDDLCHLPSAICLLRWKAQREGPAVRESNDRVLSQRREYVEWITDAKQEATRQKRLAQAVEWMSEGKSRHWKYKK